MFVIGCPQMIAPLTLFVLAEIRVGAMCIK